MLETALTDGFDVLKVGGRMSVITFHSLEDRIVKNRFKEFCTGLHMPAGVPGVRMRKEADGQTCGQEADNSFAGGTGKKSAQQKRKAQNYRENPQKPS